MDRRIEKTYTDLQASMRTLLGTATWNEITVQGLCLTAGISRSTFYKHFRDKEALLDSLLVEFTAAMKSDNNGRSIELTRTLRFLPILTMHVSQNRHLFAKTNTEIDGFPVAIRFRKMIRDLTAFEIEAQGTSSNKNSQTVDFIAGGIYHSLIGWCQESKDATHLSLLNTIDETIQPLLLTSNSED